MRPTFMGFEVARRGVMVSQKGLDIVGHNLANMGTNGYTRQRVDLYTVAPNSGSQRYGGNRTSLAGQGVDMNGIGQTRDKFLDRRFREQFGDTGKFDKQYELLKDIESAINEFDENDDTDSVMGTGLQSSLQQIFDTLKDMKPEADSQTYANILFSNVQNLTNVLHRMDYKLTQIADQAKSDLELDVLDVNSIIKKIALYNDDIVKNMSSTVSSNGEYYGPNELLDSRNSLIDELSGFGDVLIDTHSDGSVTVKMNGHTVVKGDIATKSVAERGAITDGINLVRNADGTVSMNWLSSNKPTGLTTGALTAAANIINGRGPNTQNSNESMEKGIPYYVDKLNSFSAAFANVMNNAMPELDPDGNPIQGKFRKLIETGTGYVTAKDLMVSKEWTNNKNLVIYKDKIRDEIHLTKLLDTLKNGNTRFSVNENITSVDYSGTFMGFVDDYTSTLATEADSASDRLKAAVDISMELADRRDQVSGVSQDEETVNMMTFNRSLQASSRLMTAMDEALDVIINKTGLVGR